MNEKQRTERAAVALVGDVGMSPHLFHLVFKRSCHFNEKARKVVAPFTD